LTFEELEWHYSHAGLMGRAPARQYVAAIVPPIATLPVELPGELLAEADEASREIARFDAEMGGELLPFSSVLLRSESAASSKIERLTASSRAIAMAELGAAKNGSNAPTIVANTHAMRAALALSDEPDQAAILRMHHALLRDDDPGQAGRWRAEQVWFGGSDTASGGADFVHPHHVRFPEGIVVLVGFVARADVVPLAHVAIAHAQFEPIHPFADGNGRTGRA